ncbi:tRNA pseudouridine(55) synthase TruB [Alkalibacter rhizosphaerae]|uniref:tRNA pseudouridine synthase B n=1 Tax=Alkalibacter rhizosphaerae TaxID=2815577 RepID=A0A974XH79_9FIRM|nr:tRNA pseudouridine(55) synthase TruB [Alkalibacter rhizosphaerae]QSX08685.1 tRNA pseudouridine(55) synthase TruB [Alkalibacter rhizosphaerae]
MNGLLNIYKNAGMTSHDVVHKIRKKCGIKKVGHGGTLDPMAQGVLPICIGQATRISGFLLDKDKTYGATMTLGATTDTYDREGEVLTLRPVHVTQQQIKEATASFLGVIDQVPPMYSALKKDGKKLYEYAREGITLDIPARKVTIHQLEVVRVDLPEVDLIVSCSKGTYIRSLIYDLGEMLGCGAHMSALERLQSGPFRVEDSILLNDLLEMDLEDIQKILIPMEKALSHMETVEIAEASKKYLVNGVVLYGRNIQGTLDDRRPGELVQLLCQGVFYGVGEIFLDGNWKKIKPKFIFSKEK